MRATDEATKVSRSFRPVISLQDFPFDFTHIIREGLDTPRQRGDLDGQRGHLFFEALLGGSERSDLARQDSYLFWQSQEFIGKHQATKLRPPLGV